MPIYEYLSTKPRKSCRHCRNPFEVLQAMSDKEQEEAMATEEEHAYAAATPEDLEFPGEMAAETTEAAEAEYPE